MTLKADSRFRIWILLANSLLVFLLTYFVVPKPWLQEIIRYGTLPVLAALVTFFIWVLARQLRRLPRSAYQKRFSKWVFPVVALAVGFQFAHEDYGYKILMDEYNLTATSMNMHLERSAYTPTEGRYAQGEFEIVDGYVDKRPFLYPFLLSLVHDVSGYRTTNAFILNTILTGLLFLVIYLTGFHLGGRRGGIVAILLLAGWPLLAQNATGAGFELLNFLLLSLTVFLSLSLTNRPGMDKETLLVLSAILLAHVRYESLMFLVPAGLLIGFRWQANKRLGPGWITVFAPWFLVPLFLQNRWFRSRDDLWELPGVISQPFSLSYIPENIGHAAMYFFNWSAEFPNSLFLTVLGGISLFFLLVASVKRVKNWTRFRPRDYDVLGLWALVLIGHLTLILAYHAGELDSHFATRLGMPIHLLLILAPVWLLVKEKLGDRLWVIAISTAVLFTITFSAPHSSKAMYTKKNFAEREFRWAVGQLASLSPSEVLVIDSRVSHWVSLQWQGIHITKANANSQLILEMLSDGAYKEVVALQRVTFDPVDEQSKVIREDRLPNFKLERIKEYSSRPFHGVRLSRVKL